MTNADGDVPRDAALGALKIIQNTVDAAVVLRVHGELDIATIHCLDEQLGRAEADVTPPAPVVLDLTGVTFMGSAGLASLVRHRDRCAEHGSALRLVAPNREVLRPIQLTGMDEELVTFATVDDALNH